jgi:hypothetical protein
VIYILMFYVLGFDCWQYVLSHQGAWNSREAMVWSVWTAFAMLAGLGILNPLKMLPIILLEIFYKVMWLILAAYPLWVKGALAGSKEEGTAAIFIWVFVPVIAVPWRYVFQQYVLPRR